MRRFLTIVVLASVVTVPVAAAQRLGWTISNSTTDERSNSGPIAPGPTQFAGNLYLWLACAFPGGMATAEFDVVELTGVGPPVGFTPMNGFLNAGTPSALLLAVGGCPTGPVLVGSFSVPADNLVPDIELCIVPSAANNRNETVTCVPETVPNESIGFKKAGVPGCANFQLCAVFSTERSSWSRVKGLYR